MTAETTCCRLPSPAARWLFYDAPRWRAFLLTGGINTHLNVPSTSVCLQSDLGSTNKMKSRGGLMLS